MAILTVKLKDDKWNDKNKWSVKRIKKGYYLII